MRLHVHGHELRGAVRDRRTGVVVWAPGGLDGSRDALGRGAWFLPGQVTGRRVKGRGSAVAASLSARQTERR